MNTPDAQLLADRLRAHEITRADADRNPHVLDAFRALRTLARERDQAVSALHMLTEELRERDIVPVIHDAEGNELVWREGGYQLSDAQVGRVEIGERRRA